MTGNLDPLSAVGVQSGPSDVDPEAGRQLRLLLSSASSSSIGDSSSSARSAYGSGCSRARRRSFRYTMTSAASTSATQTPLGVVVHPVQFGLVQFLEGYWGANPVARKFRELRVRHHRKRADALEEKDVEGDQEAGRLLDQYPADPALVMPTRLGNVLRKYEILAGRQYELSVLTILPHIALAARPEDLRYLDDQRTQLDLAVRVCFTAALASVLSAALLSRDGFWLFVAAIPGIFAYVAYRGAVISAREYGIAMTTLVDMNRFSLYERLHLPMPGTIAEERIANKRVMQLMESSSTHVFMRYKHPSTADGVVTSTRISNTSSS